MIGFSLALAMQTVAEPSLGPSATPFELHWSAPAECPSAGDVRAAIERHLAAPLVSPRGDGLRVDGSARSSTDGRWEVTLVVESAEGRSERKIGDATDCAAATETAALVIAIAIDPDVALRDTPATIPTPVEPTPVEPTPVEPTPVAPTTGTTPPPTVARPTPAPRLKLRAAIGGRFDVTGGAHPIVGLGGSVFVDLLIGARGRIGLGASVSGAPPARKSGATIEMLRWTIEVRGCPVFGVLRWLEIVPCAGVQAGQTRVDVTGLADAKSPRHPWVAPTALLAAVFVPRPRIGIWAGLHGLVPLYRHDYVIEDGGRVHRVHRVHRTFPVAGGALVGIEARLP